MSALVGYFAELDPEPLIQLLGLMRGSMQAVRVEVNLDAKSRIDVVIDGEQGPLAILELKVASSEHGGQYARYASWAATQGAKGFLVTLDTSAQDLPVGWQHLTLANLFQVWAASDKVGPLAKDISNVFSEWSEQVNGRLDEASDGVVYSLLVRELKNELKGAGFADVSAVKTSGGMPSLVAFKRHPSGIERAYLCADLRCLDAASPNREWVLRIGVEVEEGKDSVADRRLAHDLAMDLEGELGLERIRAVLSSAGLADVAQRIIDVATVKAPKCRDSAVEGWLAKVDEGVSLGRHPIFHHDWGLRLANQMSLDPSITRAELSSLITTILNHLVTSAQPNPN